VVELPFRCGLMSVRREAANLVTIYCIRDGAVQLVSTLGSVVISARAELGSIIASLFWGCGASYASGTDRP
jgi:hypothetical protein